MNIRRAAIIAVVQLSLTAGAIVGATIIAADATRAGLSTWPLSGQLLRDAALVLTWPAQLLVSYLDKDSPWFWVLIGSNSMLWAVVIELGCWSTYRARRRSSVA